MAGSVSTECFVFWHHRIAVKVFYQKCFSRNLIEWTVRPVIGVEGVVLVKATAEFLGGSFRNWRITGFTFNGIEWNKNRPIALKCLHSTSFESKSIRSDVGPPNAWNAAETPTAPPDGGRFVVDLRSNARSHLLATKSQNVQLLKGYRLVSNKSISVNPFNFNFNFKRIKVKQTNGIPS